MPRSRGASEAIMSRADDVREWHLRRIRHLNWCRVARDRGELDEDQLACEEDEFAQHDAARLEELDRARIDYGRLE
jgi:hypothetical protein